MSGLLNSLLTSRDGWSALFVAGLAAGGAVGAALDPHNLASLPQLSVGRYVAAGLLVGMGTRLGGGCTSGHGICGLARLSKRSIVAVATFMAAGACTAAALALSSPAGANAVAPLSIAPLATLASSPLVPMVAFSASAAALALTAAAGDSLVHALVTGTTFGLGLSISGMVHPQKVSGFLDVTGRNGPWDPSLACVMAGGLALSAAGYAVKPLLRKPVLGERFMVPNTSVIDTSLVGGSALFGIGWGLAGMCPGPALANLVLPLFKVSIGGTGAAFCAAMAVGMVIVDVFRRPEGPAAASKGKQN